MKRMMRTVSKSVPSGRFGLRMIAPLVGAAILACTAAPQASAQSFPNQGHYQDRYQDRYQDHSRGDRRGERSRPDHHQQARHGDPGPDRRGYDRSRGKPPVYGSGNPASRAEYQARREAVPSYRFNGSDRVVLQRYYQPSLRGVQSERRPQFARGHVIAPAYRPYVQVMPSRYRRHLPPPPRGYEVGYYQGYSVVYDPLTFTVLSVLDLMIN